MKLSEEKHLFSSKIKGVHGLILRKHPPSLGEQLAFPCWSSLAIPTSHVVVKSTMRDGKSKGEVDLPFLVPRWELTDDYLRFSKVSPKDGTDPKIPVLKTSLNLKKRETTKLPTGCEF